VVKANGERPPLPAPHPTVRQLHQTPSNPLRVVADSIKGRVAAVSPHRQLIPSTSLWGMWDFAGEATTERAAEAELPPEQLPDPRRQPTLHRWREEGSLPRRRRRLSRQPRSELKANKLQLQQQKPTTAECSVITATSSSPSSTGSENVRNADSTFATVVSRRR